MVQAFRKCGIDYKHSERDRSSLYLDALPLFTTGRARLLDNKRLVQQFASLEHRTSSVGKDRVDRLERLGNLCRCGIRVEWGSDFNDTVQYSDAILRVRDRAELMRLNAALGVLAAAAQKELGCVAAATPSANAG